MTLVFRSETSSRWEWRGSIVDSWASKITARAVILSVATTGSSVPIAWRLYLPEEGAKDKARRKKTKIPVGFEFQTQPRIALEQFRQAVAEQVPHAAILADAAYGNDSGFREGISNLGLKCAVGVQSSVKVWQPGEGLLPTKE